MKLYPYATHSPFFGALAFRNRLLCRLATSVFLAACILTLSVAVHSRISHQSRDRLLLSPEVAAAPSGLEAQQTDIPEFRINVDAYNARRRSLVANDSRKLLSLAVALKSELRENSGEPLSPDELQKVKEIEKLARDVKTQMTLSPVPVF
jgi:Tfp pilus assembly protein PilN